MRPDLLGSAETFRENASAFATAVRSARPAAGGLPVRMPFDRSRQERQRRVSQDAIEIPDVLYSQLARIAERKPAREPNAQPADDHLDQPG
jgi:LDH2 family malate/lactate/ureidoglycolate dehydrogenase